MKVYKFSHKTRADPATINPLETLTVPLLGFHLGFIQVIKPPDPMEQFAMSIGVSLRVYTSF